MGRRACPTPQELAAFHVGDLQEALLGEVAEHLETCAPCQTVVLQLDSAADPVLKQLRRLNQGRSPDTPPPAPPEENELRLHRLLTRLLDQRPEDALATRKAPTDFSFLAPPRDAGELGWLGAYRVVRLLGAGGMGMVFLAEDSQLRRPVALKVLRPELVPNAEARQRFLREARATAALRSEHIVTIHHVGQEKDIPFLVMELLHGQSLEEWLRGGRRATPAAVARLGREVAEGLAVAHEAGLVHRDIKPANLMLTRGTERGTRNEADSPALAGVKILDFGLARGGEDSARLTRSGFILGTPAYMSPEQARDLPLDSRCDLFSLGCVLYHLLAGEAPFRGNTAMAVLTALAVDEPAPLSLVNPEVPLGLADLVKRLLAKEPARRPDSARSVAAELKTMEDLLIADAASMPPEAQPVSGTIAPAPPAASTDATRVIRGPAPRRRRRSLAVAVLLGAGMALAGGSFFLANRARHADPSRTGDSHAAVPPSRPAVSPADADEAWLKTVLGMPANKRVERVKARLKERNPEYNQEMQVGFNDAGEVIGVSFRQTKVTDLSALRAFPALGTLTLNYMPPGIDLSTIRALPLMALDLANSHVADLAPLAGMKLRTLELNGTQVRDLGPLHGIPLLALFINGTQVSDLAPIAAARLTHFDCIGTQVRDLGPLRGMPLSILNCSKTQVESLQPLQDLRELRHLTCDHTQVRDLTPLAKLELRSVSCKDTKVSTLDALQNMTSLTSVNCAETRVRSLAPLAGTQLTDLFCWSTPVEDLAPLAKLPLTKLDCHDTFVRNLAPLRGLKLTELNIQQIKTTDLAPLQGMPLESVLADVDPQRDAELLRSLTRLRMLNGKPVGPPGK